MATTEDDVAGDEWGQVIRARLGLPDSQAQAQAHPATPMEPGETVCVACGLIVRASVHRGR